MRTLVLSLITLCAIFLGCSAQTNATQPQLPPVATAPGANKTASGADKYDQAPPSAIQSHVSEQISGAYEKEQSQPGQGGDDASQRQSGWSQPASTAWPSSDYSDSPKEKDGTAQNNRTAQGPVRSIGRGDSQTPSGPAMGLGPAQPERARETSVPSPYPGVEASAPAMSTPGETQSLTGATGSEGPVETDAAVKNKGDQPIDTPFAERYPRYLLRPGDVLDLTFDFSPEFNQEAAVQPDGFITLKGVGDVHLSGQTIPQVRRTIAAAYSKILNAPSISITLKDFEKPYFIATGEVGRPGKYELRGETTVAEAIAIAGGMNESSKHSQVVLYRRVNEHWMQGTVINVKKMMKEKNLNEDLDVKPGDMLYVPQNTISKFKKFIPTPGVGVTY